MQNEREQIICAVKARTHLENAKEEFPDHQEEIEKARVLLWHGEYAAAKAIVVGLFESRHGGRDELSKALVFILVALGEDNIDPLMNYMQRKQTGHQRFSDDVM